MSCRIASTLRDGRAAGFRRLAAELQMDPAVLAHRYALSLDIDTLVLGVKNRKELADCVAAAEAGPLGSELMARVDQSVASGKPEWAKETDLGDQTFAEPSACK
jgi:aryl-alcohol dehydrogenase-like predicted oxidoreductase